MGVPVQDMAPELEPIDFPNGRANVPVREFNLRMNKLWQQAQKGDLEAEVQLLRLCVPSITDAEIDDLTPGHKLWIITYCARRLEEVTAALKNVAGAAAVSDSPPSAPTTSTNTPSPASRARSGRTGSRKPTARSGKPSPLSIG